jgi:SAM-dependent MidA family methyltransferase
MNPLEQKIAGKIIKEGPITFETFMEMALYEPDLGYYSSDRIEIGKAGDYYTSQHLHPVFGAMLGKQLEEMWDIMGKPRVFYAIEPGAGEGYMCHDILTFLKDRDIVSSLKYVIIEPHSFLKSKQQERLKAFGDYVQWLPSLKGLNSVAGCILSNELLDAFPVHVVEMEDALKEVYVTVESETGFSEVGGPISTQAIADYLDEFSIQLPRGYRTEINLRIKDWLQEAGDVLSEGFVLTIDYGYSTDEFYSDERNRGTLLCYHRHQFNENPYQHIGEQDLTAHVNFSSVKKWGEAHGLKTLGFCPQGTYLVSLGIDVIIADLYRNSKDYLFEVAKIKRLIFPGTLGETHRVLVQYKGSADPDLTGFKLRNLAHKL